MTKPIALQLYTLRSQLAQDYESTIRQVAGFGYAGVEPFGNPDNLSAQAALIKSLGLAVPSIHVPFPGSQKEQADALRIAEAYGSRRIVSGLGPDAWGSTLDQVKQSCDRINEAARFAAQNDLVFGYHNHWWEVEPVEGTPPYKLMLERLDPAVIYEIDIYWVQTGGVDPADYIREFGPKAPLLHVKDGPADRPESDMVAVGAGRVDIPAALKAAADTAEWLIVELDRCATDMPTAVKASYDYLVSEGLGHGRQ